MIGTPPLRRNNIQIRPRHISFYCRRQYDAMYIYFKPNFVHVKIPAHDLSLFHHHIQKRYYSLNPPHTSRKHDRRAPLPYESDRECMCRTNVLVRHFFSPWFAMPSAYRLLLLTKEPSACSPPQDVARNINDPAGFQVPFVHHHLL